MDGWHKRWALSRDVTFLFFISRWITQAGGGCGARGWVDVNRNSSESRSHKVKAVVAKPSSLYRFFLTQVTFLSLYEILETNLGGIWMLFDTTRGKVLCLLPQPAFLPSFITPLASLLCHVSGKLWASQFSEWEHYLCYGLVKREKTKKLWCKIGLGGRLWTTLEPTSAITLGISRNKCSKT